MEKWLTKKAGKLALAALSAATIIAGTFLAPEASAKTLRFAFQGELKAVDPYAINESFSLSVNGSVYEGLIRRGQDMKIEPCLATSWETLDPLHWRFHLRKGVKFHDGEDFTADDVVFSADRVHSAGSDIKNRVPLDAKVVKVDDYTVDFILKTPNPLAHQRVGNLGHLLEEMVGGAWRDRCHGDERDDAALRGLARQRHRPLHAGEP